MSLNTTLPRIAIWLLGLVATLGVTGYLAARWYMGVLLPSLDLVAPTLPDNLSRPAILVFHKANGYVHTEAIPAGNRMLSELAAVNGWSIHHTDNGAVMNPGQLARFDVVVWNNTSGTTLTREQQQSFQDWLEHGGGFVGIHAAGGDPWYQWDWYVNTVLGAHFTGHTMEPQFQDAHVLEADVSDITSHLPAPWLVAQEEWYAFDPNPRNTGSRILVVLDENSYAPGNATMPGEHPVTWRHAVGDGRAFYTAIGHRGETYALPEFRTLVEQAVRWAGKIEPATVQKIQPSAATTVSSQGS